MLFNLIEVYVNEDKSFCPIYIKDYECKRMIKTILKMMVMMMMTTTTTGKVMMMVVLEMVEMKSRKKGRM